MSERLGYIYVITNLQNGKQYGGQTSRDIDVRFEEHLWETRGNSYLHKAIQKYGRNSFKVEQLEQVPISQLDEKEKYWIKELNTYENGYNLTLGGKNISFNGSYNNLLIVEKDFKIDSIEYLSRRMSEITSWSTTYIKNKIKEVINTPKEYLGYHFKSYNATLEEMVDEDVLEDWIKTLSVRFSGKHIYCKELDMEFNSIGEATNYCIKNNYYLGTSHFPEQDVRTLIGVNSKKESPTPIEILSNLTFEMVYGVTSKVESGGNFENKKVYCPQLDRTFESQIKAAEYFAQKNLFGKVKLKTAKLRISDICRGYFPDYKGYSFVVVENEENDEESDQKKLKLKKENKPSSNFQILKDSQEDIIQRYLNGESMKQIGDKYSTYANIIRLILKINNIESRTPNEHQCKSILRVNISTNKIEKIYPSIKSVKEDGFIPKSVGRALNTTKKYRNYLWIMASDYPDAKVGNIINI